MLEVWRSEEYFQKGEFALFLPGESIILRAKEELWCQSSVYKCNTGMAGGVKCCWGGGGWESSEQQRHKV